MGRVLGFGADEVARVMEVQRIPAPEPVELWDAEAATALNVVFLSELSTAFGMAGVCYTGIATTEIQAAAEALGVPFSAALVIDCRHLARGACEALNKKLEGAR